MEKLLKVIPVALAIMLVVLAVPVALAASARPGAQPQALVPAPDVSLLQASLAQTDTLTDTEALTETETLTDTESITETDEVTATETLTDTEILTETESLTETEEVTGTDTVTGTGTTTGAGTTPLAAGCAQDYVVQTGDTLGSIAATFLGSSGAFNAIVEATNAAGTGYATIDDPNLISVGQTLCIPASAAGVAPAQSTGAVTQTETTTDTGLLGEDIAADLPEGKSKLVFENLSSFDLVFDLSGPTLATMIIPPSGKQEFIIDPGAYTYNGHQPGGGFTIAPGNFDIAAGKVTGIACYDNSQCQPVIQTPQIETSGTVTGTTTVTGTETATETTTTTGTTDATGTTDQTGTTQDDQSETTQDDQQGTDQEGQEGTDEGDQEGTDQEEDGTGEEGTDQEDDSGTTNP